MEQIQTIRQEPRIHTLTELDAVVSKEILDINQHDVIIQENAPLEGAWSFVTLR